MQNTSQTTVATVRKKMRYFWEDIRIIYKIYWLQTHCILNENDFNTYKIYKECKISMRLRTGFIPQVH